MIKDILLWLLKFILKILGVAIVFLVYVVFLYLIDSVVLFDEDSRKVFLWISGGLGGIIIIYSWSTLTNFFDDL